jgi:hypothetical protein
MTAEKIEMPVAGGNPAGAVAEDQAVNTLLPAQAFPL